MVCIFFNRPCKLSGFPLIGAITQAVSAVLLSEDLRGGGVAALSYLFFLFAFSCIWFTSAIFICLMD